MVDILGYITAVSILVAYGVATLTDRWIYFHWANAVGSTILVPLNIVAGSGFAAFLSAGFGLIGWGKLWYAHNHATEIHEEVKTGYYGPET